MIRLRLLVGFVLVALLPIIAVSIGTYIVSYQSGRQQTIDRLEAVAARKELAIQGWEQSLQQELQTASQMDYSSKFINNALRLANENYSYTWYNNLVRKRMQGFIDQSSHFDELFLLDNQGKVVISTDVAREGKIYADQAFFQQGLREPFAQLPFYSGSSYSDTSDSLPQDSTSVIIVTPIIDVDGQPMGVMGGRGGIDDLITILNERTGLGETGRAYLVNREHALLAGIQLVYGNSTAGKKELYIINSQGIVNAIQFAANDSGIYKDVFGESVIGSYRWIPNFQTVLSVEQDSSEALRAVSATTDLNLVVALASVVIAVFASFFMTRSIADPIIHLSNTASQIANGDLERTADVENDDEVGALARAFNSMTSQLRDLINSLERRIAERTSALQTANEALERRALQMETSAQVGREITSILDIDVLLNRVVELIGEAFGYYHVQIFLLDEDSHQLVLRACSGNRNIQYPKLNITEKSINGKVAQTGEPLLVNDTSQNVDFLFDSQLPDTRSELVVPLRLGVQAIGTLDVHNSKVNAFTIEDILLIQSLADQIVVVIENAHLYDQSRELAILEERNRLARELHDSVTQALYSLVLLSEGWRRTLHSTGSSISEEYLNRIGEISHQALKEMRMLIHELRPPTLEQEGLVGALRKRFDALEKRVGIEARVVMEDFIELPSPIEEGLYRIAQEALNNSLKHAEGTCETVRICVEGGMVVLEVVDNGRGFDPEHIEQGGGMGLASMRERMRQLGGTLTIISGKDTGTIVKASVPLP
jgi:signal transduction histidine kinase